MELKDVKMYQASMSVGRDIWKIVSELSENSRRTIGYQIIRSADSIAANISESEGMYHYGDKKRFLYYARGSAYETITWLNKLSERDCISSKQFQYLESATKETIRLINGSIRSIPSK